MATSTPNSQEAEGVGASHAFTVAHQEAAIPAGSGEQVFVRCLAQVLVVPRQGQAGWRRAPGGGTTMLGKQWQQLQGLRAEENPFSLLLPAQPRKCWPVLWCPGGKARLNPTPAECARERDLSPATLLSNHAPKRRGSAGLAQPSLAGSRQQEGWEQPVTGLCCQAPHTC